MATSIHVVPDGTRWAVTLEGVERPLSTHHDDVDAARAGRKVARAFRLGLVVHDRDGRVSLRDSYVRPEPFAALAAQPVRS